MPSILVPESLFRGGQKKKFPKAQVSVEQSLELTKRTQCLFLFDYSVATDHCFGLKVSSPQILMKRNIVGAQPGFIYLPNQRLRLAKSKAGH